MKKAMLICVLCGLILTGYSKADETSTSSNITAESPTITMTENTTTNAPKATTVPEVTSEIVTTSPTEQTTTTTVTKQDTETVQQTENKPEVTVKEDVPSTEQSADSQVVPQRAATTTKAVTTAEKPVTTTKVTVTQPQSTGISQSDRDEINRYIKEIAQPYSIGTQCSDCNNEGAVILTGNVDIWSSYSFNAPISTKINKTVDSIKNSVDTDIKTMYNEWIRNGETVEDISECMYISVYWEKDSDRFWLYLMW